MKIRNRRHRRSDKLDGIRVGRIGTFPFLPIPFMTPSLFQFKLNCRRRKQKRKNQAITRPKIDHCDWFILKLLIPSPKIYFSLDHQRLSHKRNGSSASSSVSSITFISYRFTFLITNLPTTLSIVKTSLY